MKNAAREIARVLREVGEPIDDVVVEQTQADVA